MSDMSPSRPPVRDREHAQKLVEGLLHHGGPYSRVAERIVDALLGQPDPELTGRPEDDRLVAERADEPAWVERAERAEERLREAVTNAAELEMLRRCHEDRSQLKQRLRAVTEAADVLLEALERVEITAQSGDMEDLDTARFGLRAVIKEVLGD